METQGVSGGLGISTSGGNTLESVIGEISGSSMAASSKGLYSGHSRTSHSPGVVSDLTVSTLSKTEVRLDWTAAGRDGNIGQASYVEIKIATYPVTYANYSTIDSSLTVAALSPGTLDQQIYSNLSPGKTYYVAIRVRDSANMFGRISSSTVSTVPIKPQAPCVLGVLSGTNFTISWSAVNSNVDGSTITVKGYAIYSSTSITGSISGPVSLSSSTLSYMTVSSPVKWYFVKTVDENDVESDASIWLSNSDESARTVADDNRAVVDISPAMNAILNSEGLVPVVVNQPAEEVGAILSAYKFYLRDAANNIVNRDLDEDATLILPLSRTGYVSINSIGTLAAYSDYDYAVYYFNGVEEVKIGGTVNPTDRTVSVLTKKTGLFKVKRVIRAQGFAITQTVPRKIFTPNGDGIWDEFHIIFENPEGLSITGAKVYDLGGREIAKLVSGTYNLNASLMWDGKRNGSVARAGIYIYQFKAGGKYYNGTMVLAK